MKRLLGSALDWIIVIFHYLVFFNSRLLNSIRPEKTLYKFKHWYDHDRDRQNDFALVAVFWFVISLVLFIGWFWTIIATLIISLINIVVLVIWNRYKRK